MLKLMKHENGYHLKPYVKIGPIDPQENTIRYSAIYNRRQVSIDS